MLGTYKKKKMSQFFFWPCLVKGVCNLDSYLKHLTN